MTPIHTVWTPCCSQVAELKKLAQRPGRAWAWCLWECTLKLPEGTKAGGKLHLLCRAVDDNVNAQVGRERPVVIAHGPLPDCTHTDVGGGSIDLSIGAQLELLLI